MIATNVCMKMKKIVILLLGVLLSLAAEAQTTITGRITDARTGESLIGASLVPKNSGELGAVTDIEGNFTLQTNVKLPLTLSVQYVGYRTLDVDVYDAEEPLEIQLVPGGNRLSEVVVVGYGVQKRQELTSSISTVGEELLNQNISSVESVLQGSVAGINVTTSSGQPGATSTIRIRGGNSITGGNEPLYVIDGFIVYNDPATSRTNARGSDATLDPMSFLNPSDIESIEVLKDVSATAIYGTRGANGVIMITTKKGKHGRDNVNYSGTFSWSKAARKLDYLNAQQWTELYNEIRLDEGSGEPLAIPTESYDWQDAALRTGFSQEHQVSLIGGDEKSRYNISFGYKDVQGIILGTDQTRYAGRVNYDRTVNNKFSFGVTANGAYNKVNGLRNENGNNAPNSWVAAITHTPYTSIWNADGSFNYSPTPSSDAVYDGQVGNPISDLENIKSTTENTRIIGTGWAEYEILPHLKAKVNLGADITNTRQSNYSPSYTSTGLANKGVASVGQTKTNVWQTEYTLSYQNVFARVHSLSLLAGYTAQRTALSTFATSNYGYSNDATGYDALGAAATTQPSYSYASVNTLQSWLGRVNYSYDKRYNATLTLRADGSSRFAKGHKWGWFPSIGASWNLDQEKFLHFGKQVDFIQLRASAGVVGNQEIGDYQFVANMSPATYVLNGQRVTAYLQSNMASPDLKWESTASYNVGVSSGFFNSRLTVTLDAYYKKTSDLLLNVPTEGTTGFSSVLRNIGSVTNKGVELEVGGVLLDDKNWHWTANANIAHNKNEVTSLGDASQIIPDFNGIGTMQYLNPLIVKVGEPLGTFFGYRFLGIVQNGDDITKLPAQTISALEPGNPRYADVNGDNVVNEEDRVTLGNAQPKFTYGFNTTLKYKQWDLFVNLAGSYGNKLFNVLKARFSKGNISYNALAEVADRWTATNPSNTIQKASNSTSIVTDDRYVEDASYLRVKNIQLGYTLPLKRLSRDAKLRISISLQNFFTITGYSGYDPESNRNGIDETNALYQGIDWGAYPTAKTVQLGVSLTL